MCAGERECVCERVRECVYERVCVPASKRESVCVSE